MYIYDVSALYPPRFAMTLNENHAYPRKYLLYMLFPFNSAQR